MSARPELGDWIETAYMGAGSRIEVCGRLRDQPLAENFGMYLIVDQHGDTLLVEQDAGVWTIVNPDSLEPRALDIYQRAVMLTPAPGI